MRREQAHWKKRNTGRMLCALEILLTCALHAFAACAPRGSLAFVANLDSAGFWQCFLATRVANPAD